MLNPYFECVQAVQKEDKKEIRFYPGSPKIVRHFLCSNDQMILNELKPEVH